ncbi:MAG: aminotransferase class I/II-fold pyridoxal phosphate-dependent enzyme, partial [Burkholderiaceae bacterium]|nr:aminotransferase class I/II-fold pyridoxal phosphate-dependent enzyme [Burkholderiaceae bacterium]
LDLAYAPLQLSKVNRWEAGRYDHLWQLYSPNKALGLTGVRAAYAIAPLDAQERVNQLAGLCASWPLGAHGVALLGCWVSAEVQDWLKTSLQTLGAWKVRQIALLQALGWTCLPSDTHFFCAKPGRPLDLTRLRAAGIKLRDTTSFGLPGYFRLSVQPPMAQDALKMSLQTGRSSLQ